MFKNSLYLLCLLGIFLFSQCSNDPVQDDLLNYINEEIPKVAPLESEAIDAYSSVSGENYKSDSLMYYKIKDVVVPKYSEFYEKLQGINPKTDELKKVHGEYVEAAKDQLEGFRLVLSAIEKQSEEEIKRANDDLDKAGVLIDSWKRDIKDLCAKHEVELKK